MERAVVIGSTPAALRAAAFLADRGIAVRYLGVSGQPHGLGGGPAFDPGIVAAPDTESSAGLARVWKSVAPVRDASASQGLLVRDTVWDLPLSRPDIFRVFPPQVAQQIVSGVAGSRLAQRVGSLTSLGREERTYAQWVQHRFGDVVYEQLHGPYARKRFATDAEHLSAPTAYKVHGHPNQDEPLLARGHGVDEARAHQLAAILAAGGEILAGVEVQGLEVADGRVVAVMTDSGREHVDGLLVTDATPHTVHGWLPEGTPSERWALDIAQMTYVNEVQVTVPARSSLPQALHVADAALPFWKLTRFGLLPGEDRWKDTVTAHLTLRSDDPLWTGSDAALVDRVKSALGGLAEVSTGEVSVQRLPEHQLVNEHVTQLCIMRRLDEYDSLGILGVGSRGAMRLTDIIQEQALVDGAVETEAPKGRVLYQRDVHRFIYEQPVRLPPQGRLTPFVSR